MDELVAGLAGIALTLAIFVTYYGVRERRRQRGAAPRQERFSRTGEARIPVEYEDRPDGNLPTEPTSLNGSFTLAIKDRGITADPRPPALFGDPSTFWRCLLADLHDGTLPLVEIQGDAYLLARLSFPPSGRVLLRLLSADLQILRQVETVEGTRT
ncbi:hypothetical protein [Terrabacter sp. 2YAF2]|uniref:hypothetical protein n=1 Tax=Terrabacter sp. 2YAF2 TaxID=3233026 RepID=UPI003F9DADB2